MSGDAASEGAGRMIPIDQLSLQDLTNIQKQLDKELTFFGESLQELRGVHSKFRETSDALTDLTEDKAGREILVPLTSSMYVPGKLKSADTVLVDMGTGYYADMRIEKAREFFQRKQSYLSKQIDSVQNIMTEKQRTKAVILGALETKVQQALAAQQSQQK